MGCLERSPVARRVAIVPLGAQETQSKEMGRWQELREPSPVAYQRLRRPFTGRRAPAICAKTVSTHRGWHRAHNEMHEDMEMPLEKNYESQGPCAIHGSLYRRAYATVLCSLCLERCHERPVYAVYVKRNMLYHLDVYLECALGLLGSYELYYFGHGTI